MGEQGFWDDQERAASVSSEHASLSRRLETYRSLERDLEDLETLEEMAAEDDSIAAELEEQRAGIEGRLAELEEARLFSGKYDAGSAVVTVNAGAGGTDSCESRPSTPPRAATPPSPGWRWRRSWRTTWRSRSTPRTSRSTPTGPRGPAASTSTRRTPRCASRTAPPG